MTTKINCYKKSVMRSAGRCLPGFTLVELIAVIGVLVVLTLLVIPAVGPLLRSSNLNGAAAMITDELNMARQLAISQNRDVEVRFYELGSEADPDDKKFRAFRLLYADGNDPSKSKPVGKVNYLPEPLIISSNAEFSSLLDHTNSARSGLSHAQEALPGISEPANYVGFLFRATGGTNLGPIDPPEGNWYLTIHHDNAPINPATGLPDNYYTAQVEPVTGRVFSFRP